MKLVWALLLLQVCSVFTKRISPWSCAPQPDNTTHAGNYIILAPKVFRPGLTYAVGVNLLKAQSSPVKVSVEIRDSKNKSIATGSTSDLQAGKPKTVTINSIPKTLVESEKFTLYAKGESSGKVIFEDEDEIQMNLKSTSIFVQTDKAKYKPGETVRYRVVAVNPDLKPHSGTIDIKITDPQSNVLRQYLKQPLKKGVYGSEFILSQEPSLGSWTIKVELDGATQKYDKSFSVDKYVLPKFDATIEAPSFITNSSDLTVKVTSKYTYGKGVQGSAKIKAENPYIYQEEQKKSYHPIEKNATLDQSGMASVTFKNAELIKNNLIVSDQYSSYNYIQLTAVVSEQLTGIEATASGGTSVYQDVESVSVTQSSQTFKPGLNYTFSISVTKKDGKPLDKDADRTVFVNVSYSFPYEYVTLEPNGAGVDKTKKPLLRSSKITLSSDGTKTLTEVPPKGAQSMSIFARYKKEDSSVYGANSVQPSKSPSDTYIQLTPTSTEPLKAGQTAKFDVQSTEKIGKLTWQVMSRGHVVQSADVSVSGNSATVSFPVTAEMAPKSRLVVYRIRPENEEIVVDSLDFPVDGLFKNNVSIIVTPDKTQPYDANGKKNEVQFRIKADPNSYVGLLAVDQSVILLASGNDISQSDVINDIYQYDISGSYYGRGCFDCIDRRKRESWWGWYMGGKDAYTLLDNSGFLTLTDAYLYMECMQPVFAAAGKLDGGLVPVNQPVPVVDQEVVDTKPKAPSVQSNALIVRKDFPESWIWVEIDTASNGETVYKAKVPDTITSWVASAFAINDDSGLGIAPEPAKLTVFRPFFVSLNLPYSVKRGEKVALQVLVFNYQEKDEKVTVELQHDDKAGFDFVDKSESQKSKDTKGVNLRQVSVPGGGGSKTVFFPITSKIIGSLKLTVRAVGQSATDGLEMPLLVEAEGVPLYFNKPVVVDLTKNSSHSQSFAVAPPSNATVVEGSFKAELSLIGDIMGPVLANIDELVRMPYGCGEQNMLNFVPNIVVRQYLSGTKRLTPDLDAKTLKYIEAGYQREMTYRHEDGSFSAFGQSDPQGSTWLTAFVLRSFRQARDQLPEEKFFVDKKILEQSLAFIQKQQKDGGDFKEQGEVHHKDMQGGSGQGGVPLTSYCLLALLENDVKNSKALNYVENALSTVSSDPYALAIASYALHKANSTKKDTALGMLEKLAIVQEGQKHWEKVVKSDESDDDLPSWYRPQPLPVNVEMTSYALLTYILRGQVSEAVPIVRWLSSQRNDLGGWSSTQDTVVGIQALGAFAGKIYSGDVGMQCTVTQGKTSQKLSVDKENSIVLQKVQLNSSEPVQLQCSGKGMAFAQASWHYNVPQLHDQDPFDCEHHSKESGPDGGELLVNFCCKYKKKGRSNMAVFEIKAPSGFTVDEEKLLSLQKGIKDLQRTEMDLGNTKGVIYFNSMGDSPSCFNVTSVRQFQVANKKPAFFSLYDYYGSPNTRIDRAYTGDADKSLADLCPECWPNEITAPKNIQGSEFVHEEPKNQTAASQEECSDMWTDYCQELRKESSKFCASESEMVKKNVKKYCKKTCNLC